MKVINGNQNVYFKVKPLGEEVLEKKGYDLKPNEKGLYSLPIWIFMAVFGEYMKYVGLTPNEYFSMSLHFDEDALENETELNN